VQESTERLPSEQNADGTVYIEEQSIPWQGRLRNTYIPSINSKHITFFTFSSSDGLYNEEFTLYYAAKNTHNGF